MNNSHPAIISKEKALDIPEGTIKSRLSRAREFLKEQLSDEEEKRPMPGKNSKPSKRITGKGKMSMLENKWDNIAPEVPTGVFIINLKRH